MYFSSLVAILHCGLYLRYLATKFIFIWIYDINASFLQRWNRRIIVWITMIYCKFLIGTDMERRSLYEIKPKEMYPSFITNLWDCVGDCLKAELKIFDIDCKLLIRFELRKYEDCIVANMTYDLHTLLVGVQHRRLHGDEIWYALWSVISNTFSCGGVANLLYKLFIW